MPTHLDPDTLKLAILVLTLGSALSMPVLLGRARQARPTASEPESRTRYEDVSGLHLAPPRRLARKVAELEALGYYRLGEMRMHHPFPTDQRPPLGMPRASIVWVLQSPDGTIVVTVAGMGPFSSVELTSVFDPEGRVVVAWQQPLAFRVLMVALLRSLRSPRYGMMLPFWGGVARADRAHRELVEHVAQHCGRPRVWRDLRSFAEWSSIRTPLWEGRIQGVTPSHA